VLCVFLPGTALPVYAIASVRSTMNILIALVHTTCDLPCPSYARNIILWSISIRSCKCPIYQSLSSRENVLSLTQTPKDPSTRMQLIHRRNEYPQAESSNIYPSNLPGKMPEPSAESNPSAHLSVSFQNKLTTTMIQQSLQLCRIRAWALYYSILTYNGHQEQNLLLSLGRQLNKSSCY
jgi:hypothetical protein